MVRLAAAANFYPRPPRGGRLSPHADEWQYDNISIHALREEGDQHTEGLTRDVLISIHALREEGDKIKLMTEV